MRIEQRFPVCALVGLSLIGCSGASATPGDGSGSGKIAGGSASGGSNGGSGSGGSSSGSVAGGGSGAVLSSSGSGGAAAGGGSSSDGGMVAADVSTTIDPDIAYSVTLTMDAFVVDPGQEVYMCQDFANPFKGQQADIKTYELHMAQGSHHMFAFYKPNATNGAVTTCPQGGLQFAPFTFTAQSRDVLQTYPQSVGATIPSTTGFTLNVHYVNTGSTPIAGHVALTLFVAKSGIVTQHAGVIFLNQVLLNVPSNATMAQPYVARSTFSLPNDAYLMSSGSHMHKRALNFTADTSTGQKLFQTTQWAEPAPADYSPPVHLTAGTGITWSCSYYNDTGKPLTFGESASTNVMCISVSIFYPVPDITNPVIGTQF